jgi:hypothetical protein
MPKKQTAITLPVPDAATLERFLHDAGSVWRQAHWSTLIKMMSNTPVVSWPGKSRTLDGGLYVELSKDSVLGFWI